MAQYIMLFIMMLVVIFLVPAYIMYFVVLYTKIFEYHVLKSFVAFAENISFCYLTHFLKAKGSHLD